MDGRGEQRVIVVVGGPGGIRSGSGLVPFLSMFIFTWFYIPSHGPLNASLIGKSAFDTKFFTMANTLQT